MLLDVGDDEVGASEVIDSGWARGVVHGVGEVADQGDVLSEFHHLANAEGPS